MIGFDYSEEYLRSISNKILLWSVKKSKYSFSYHLQVGEKVNNVSKSNPRRKADSIFDFPKLPSNYEVLIRMIKVVHITFYTKRG